MKDFPFSRAKSYADNFSKGESELLLTKLIAMSHDSRRGLSDIGLALEELALGYHLNPAMMFGTMDIKKLSAGKKPPSEINVFIEITQGSGVKYELDKESGVVVADRFLHTSMHYPFNYGFIPSTVADDGDPVDVLLLSSAPLQPGTMIEARPIGMLEMEDEAGLDDKILAVPKAKIDPTTRISTTSATSAPIPRTASSISSRRTRSSSPANGSR